MKAGFYPRLAYDGIRKNKRMYFPYVLTGAVMVMMHYILSSLMESPELEEMPGGSVLMTALPLGCAVIVIFSLLFLFYTNSFLIKQRYREFGLYNILGMDKRNISHLMVWETLFTAMIAIIVGLVTGVAFSKAAELILLNLLGMKVTFTLTIGLSSLKNTALIFAAIYVVLLINSLIKVRRSKPLELVQSSKVGEKIPKFTWLFALVGAALLVWAYYLAVSIEEPATALFMFFLAVIMVIVGTYMVFISGSVAFCRMLQKNKKYYYKPNHFVSVSSMVYRMKRNGAGLASICILLTMVLVMLSSTTTLYFGEENSIRNRYPNGINIKIGYDVIDGIEDENLNALRDDIAQYAPHGTDLTGTRYAFVPGLFTEDGIIINYLNAGNTFSYDNVGCLYVISLEDYNNMMNVDKTLADDECFIYCERLTTKWDTFAMEYGSNYKVKERLTEFREDGDSIAMTMPCAYLVVKDLYAFAEPVFELKNSNGDSMMTYEWLFGFDMPTVEEERSAKDSIHEMIARSSREDNTIRDFYVESREEQRFGFYELYGSLFFLGIMLSIVFLLAAVLIIYYKQISEGYEDQNRFEIMQKVGMTKKDIRKSINSQMLTVFFLPLVMAGIHLAFAFPFISKILLMFAFDDMLLNVMVTLICFAIFGLFYAIVYKITSGSYYAIVSGRK
ncbi:MAG: FtsX-like permease family protein [Ruminococcus sp.]